MRAAVPLARSLLTLADAGSSGMLRVSFGGRRAELCVARGKAVSLVGVDGELLGDTLMRVGDLDTTRHHAALQAGEPCGPVGRWLVEVGAASPAAVARALSRQLERRLSSLLRWPEPAFRFVPAPSVARWAGEASADIYVCVWLGLLDLSRDLTQAQRERAAGTGELALTRSGLVLREALIQRGLLERDGAALAWIAAAPGNQDTRVVVRALHAAVEVAADHESYSLLLRKQREIRRRAAPHTLLDLPASARPLDARRALRKLATKLHPDRFDRDLPALRSVSGEVMRALFRAEEALRVRGVIVRGAHRHV